MVMMWSWQFSLRWSTIAASEVDLPEPVPPTKNHEAAFFHHHVFQDGRQIEAVEIRDFAGNGAEHQRRCTTLHHGIDTEAAGVGQTDGEVAFVGGGNSSICLVDIIEKAISIHFSEVSGSSVIGVILPSTFIAGGKLVVIKRSEPLYLFIWRSQVNNSSLRWEDWSS